VIDGTGKHLLPGIIDGQVHFRDPGFTHKGDLYTESKAAVAGGVTSFIDMPNTVPNILTVESLKEKYAIASKSLANYSFFMGVNGDNIDEIIKPIPVNSLGFLMTACTLQKGNLL
jgi:dihydroorotase